MTDGKVEWDNININIMQRRNNLDELSDEKSQSSS